MSAETGAKRQTSERRRVQNKLAQKNYRERQRRNFQVLRDIAGSRHGFLIDHINEGVRSIESGIDMRTHATPEIDGVHNAPLTHSHLEAITVAESRDGSFGRTGQQHQSFRIAGLPLTPETSQEHGILGQLLQQAGLVLDDEARFQILEKKVDLQSILKAGLKALLPENLDVADCSTSHGDKEGCATNNIQLRTDKILIVQNASNEHGKECMASLPNIPRNSMRIKQVLFLAACVANASSLGLSLENLSCGTTESSFFRSSVSESTARTLCLNNFSHLNTRLRPCIGQLTYSHHPYIDVLPFPTFRDRLITLACAKEPMIDEDELCKDLQNDG